MKIDSYEEVWRIWLESREKMKAYLQGRFQDKDLAEEVSQEVVLKLHRACCSDREIKNVNSWMYQIAHNAALDSLKKRKKDEQQIPEPDSEDPKLWQEMGPILDPIMKLLPEEQAAALRMADLEGRSQQEVADEQGISLTAAKSRIQRARKQVKEQIHTCCHLEFNQRGDLVDFEIKDSCGSLKHLKK